MERRRPAGTDAKADEKHKEKLGLNVFKVR
jgi:hypothetical protein